MSVGRKGAPNPTNNQEKRQGFSIVFPFHELEGGRPSVPDIGESKTSAAVNMSSASTQVVGKRKMALLFPGMPAQLFAIGEPLPYFPGSVQSIGAFINARIMQVGHLLYGTAT